jgi:hypothetical protein
MLGQAAKRTLILFTAFIFTILAYSLSPHFLKWIEEKQGVAIHRIRLDNLDRAGGLLEYRLECRKVKIRCDGLFRRDAERLAASILSDGEMAKS